jgi:hypothetical protein
MCPIELSIGNIVVDDSKKVATTVKNRRALKITPFLIFGLIVMNALLSLAFVIRSNQEITMPPVYAADGYTGSVTKLVTIPYNSQEGLALSNFAINAVTYCLSLTFSDVNDVLEDCKVRYFADAGHKMYVKALTDNGMIGLVRSGKGIIKTVSDGIPTLAEPGSLGKQSVYTIEVPIVIDKKQVGVPSKPARQVAIIMIARDESSQSYGQFRVVQFFVESR